MEISSLDPKKSVGVGSSFVGSINADNANGASFAEVLKAQATQGEANASSAFASLLARGGATVAAQPEKGVIELQAVAPTKLSVASASSALGEWASASHSKSGKSSGSPLALAGHDASLAGRYDVLARRNEDEARGARHSHRV